MANELLTEFQSVDYRSTADLERVANMILNSAGLDATGRAIGTVSSHQKAFENRLQLGAYSTNGAKR